MSVGKQDARGEEERVPFGWSSGGAVGKKAGRKVPVGHHARQVGEKEACTGAACGDPPREEAAVPAITRSCPEADSKETKRKRGIPRGPGAVGL